MPSTRQIQSARIKSYRSWAVNETPISQTACDRLKKIQLFNELKDQKCCTTVALKAIETKRSTLFLWKKHYREKGLVGLNPKSTRPRSFRTASWPKEVVQLVLKLRQKHPYWGRAKIHRLIVRDYGKREISVSTVGRMLNYFIESNQIKPVFLCVGKRKAKKKRVFKGHAKRWSYRMKGKAPGELIQIDHMSVYCTSKGVKHFKAVCPVSKVMIAQVYSRATSRNARDFLEYLIQQFPGKVKSIQVDGGSEFMKEFEQGCQEKGIALFVLPPRSPKYNGQVERANGCTREEFYSQYTGLFDLSNLRKAISQYQHFYNHYRPHQALDYLTPAEYTKEKFNLQTFQSNNC